MNNSEARYNQLRRELLLRKTALREAAYARENARSVGEAIDEAEKCITLTLGKQIVANPAAAAAVAVGVMSALGPWRSVRLASRAIAVASLAKRLTR